MFQFVVAETRVWRYVNLLSGCLFHFIHIAIASHARYNLCEMQIDPSQMLEEKKPCLEKPIVVC